VPASKPIGVAELPGDTGAVPYAPDTPNRLNVPTGAAGAGHESWSYGIRAANCAAVSTIIPRLSPVAVLSVPGANVAVPAALARVAPCDPTITLSADEFKSVE